MSEATKVVVATVGLSALVAILLVAQTVLA
jgi:hypothetical protein